MGTFAQWVKTQEDDHETAIGYFARFWASVTPGKISSIDGVKRHLDKIDKSYADSHDEAGKAKIGAAINGFHLAVTEYHKIQAADRAKAMGLDVRVPDEPPPATIAPVDDNKPDDGPSGSGTDDLAAFRAPHERYEMARDATGPRIVRVPDPARDPALDSHPEPDDAPRAPELPSSRLARMEQMLDVMTESWQRQVAINEMLARKLDAVLNALYPEPIDWDALWGHARSAYEDEAFPRDHAE